MSFAYTAKMEVLNNKIENDCCSIAFLSAIIKTAGEISLDNQHNLKVEILTELESLFERIDGVIFQYYGKHCSVSKIEDVDIVKIPRFKIELPGEIVDKLLVDLGIMNVLNGGLNDINETIANFIIADDCCKRAYVMGAFVGCATSNIRIKSYSNAVANSSGYHLEFVFSKEKLAEDFLKLLSFFDIKAKKTKRKKSFLVYIKEYQLICDTLALVGANRAVLELQNEAAIRDLRNNINRQTNCLNANIAKTVNASVKQLNAIKVIQEEVGLESLDEELMELCLIRLANPDESLESLRKLYKYNITKSGLNHRFNKLIAKAEKIEKEKNVRPESVWL